MRLAQISILSREAVMAFEDSMKSFYESHFANLASSRRLGRWMQDIRVSNFATSVTVTNQKLDNQGGNTITFDQIISFDLVSGRTVSATGAQQLLVVPFVDAQSRDEFLTQLQASDSAFVSVTSVDAPNVPLPQEDDLENMKKDNDDKGISIFIFIVVGALVFCCCTGAAAFFYSRQSGDRLLDDNRDDMNENDNDNDKVFTDEGVDFGEVHNGVGLAASTNDAFNDSFRGAEQGVNFSGDDEGSSSGGDESSEGDKEYSSSGSDEDDSDSDSGSGKWQ